MNVLAKAAMAEKALTVLFMPESAHGPTNNCIGIADVLRERGHRAVFAAEASWKGKLEPLGFEEELVELAAPPDGPEVLDAGQFWKDFVASTAPEFKKPTIDQLDSWIRPVWQELIAGARHCEAQLNVITERVHPDVVVEDNVVCFPALLTAGAPFVRVVSCNPLEMKASDLPPTFSGYPSFDSSSWQDFRAEYEAVMRPVFEEFDAWVRDEGAPGLPDLEFIHEGAANLYVYPECADYARKEALGPTWWRLDSSVRETERAFVLPESLRGTRGGGAVGGGGRGTRG
ncbi:MAG: glycosyl transferase, partial [Acidimicrobiales bacterium]